jgi:hypothetical protein
MRSKPQRIAPTGKQFLAAKKAKGAARLRKGNDKDNHLRIMRIVIYGSLRAGAMLLSRFGG